MEKRKQLIFIEDSKGIVKIKNKNGHLYVLSDDEIKEGDWYYCKRLNKIFQAIKGITYNIEGNEHKIIATTDESLEPINLYGNSGLFKTFRFFYI